MFDRTKDKEIREQLEKEEPPFTLHLPNYDFEKHLTSMPGYEPSFATVQSIIVRHGREKANKIIGRVFPDFGVHNEPAKA